MGPRSFLGVFGSRKSFPALRHFYHTATNRAIRCGKGKNVTLDEIRPLLNRHSAGSDWGQSEIDAAKVEMEAPAAPRALVVTPL